MSPSRRTFLKQSAVTVAAAGVGSCAPEGGAASGGTATGAPALDQPILAALGEAVLPAELGREGTERAIAAFVSWADGLEPVAELQHPYLVPEVRLAGPDPRPGWAAQLAALDLECTKRHETRFTEADVPTRRGLLSRHLEGRRGGLGPPERAEHVCLALLAHFFGSPTATDLCYGRAIGVQGCRGLDGVGDEPAVLPVSGGAS